MPEPDIALFFIAGTIIIMCFSVAVIVAFVLYKQRQVRNILARKEAETRYAETLLRTRLEVQEATLSAVSRDLHDNIIQVITGGVLYLNNAIPLLPDGRAAQTIVEAKELIRTGIADLRRMSHSLNTGLVETRDLSDMLDMELQRIRSFSGIACALEAGEERQPGPEQRLFLFRIAQEALQNALKHADAGAITVSLHSADGIYAMRVSDNGKGFKTDAATASIGLRNMRERAAAIGGTFQLDSIPGQGTIITVAVPLRTDYGTTDKHSAGR